MVLTNVQKSDAGTYECMSSNLDEDDMMQLYLDNSANNYDSVENYSDEDFTKEFTIVLRVKSVPGTVSRLTVRISTILGVLMWEFSKDDCGGYPLKSFTAEIRRYPEDGNNETEWERLDPNNIPSNVVRIRIKYVIRLLLNLYKF